MNDITTAGFDTSCRHFTGTAPCARHKRNGTLCHNCEDKEPTDIRFLIIKLGAIGDVLRTTPLLRKIRAEHTRAEIWWLTENPDILPDMVDRKLAFSLSSVLQIEATRFDFVINLDKDPAACALASRINCAKQRGFTLRDGKPFPADEGAAHKFITGISDAASKANRKSYLTEIFEICGWPFSGETYVLPAAEQLALPQLNTLPRPLIGLNTGCGERWESRKLPERVWTEVALGLKNKGYGVILLGGTSEHERNIAIAAESGAFYPGHFSLGQFQSLVAQTDLVITGATLALHLAIGTGRKVVLLNNIFNPCEFELYGGGTILEPDIQCQCYFSPQCRNNEYFCMDHIPAAKIIDAAQRLLPIPASGYGQ